MKPLTDLLAEIEARVSALREAGPDGFVVVDQSAALRDVPLLDVTTRLVAALREAMARAEASFFDSREGVDDDDGERRFQARVARILSGEKP